MAKVIINKNVRCMKTNINLKTMKKNKISKRILDTPLCSIEIKDSFKTILVIAKNENGFNYFLPFIK